MGVVQNSIDIQKIIASGGDPEIAERVAQLETEIGDENSGIIKDIDDLQEANALIMTSVSAIKTTADSAKARADQAVLWSEGKDYVGKNLIKSEATDTTESNVVLTVNADKSVTVYTTGTGATANVGLVLQTIVNNGDITRPDLLKGKKYILDGCPENGSDDTYYLQWFHYNGSDVARDYGNGVIVTTPNVSSQAGYDNIAIRITSGASIPSPGITFKPMLRLASIEDGTYEPYLPNNNELLQTATLKSVTAAASDFAAFKTAIAAL